MSNVQPVQDSPRRVPLALKHKVQVGINELENPGIIQKVEGHSDWISIALYTDMMNKLRVTLAPKELNKTILRPRYQIPTIEEVLPQVSNANIFSLLEGNDGIFQIKLHEESKEFTTFSG